jgi:hypothetical protein
VVGVDVVAGDRSVTGQADQVDRVEGGAVEELAAGAGEVAGEATLEGVDVDHHRHVGSRGTLVPQEPGERVGAALPQGAGRCGTVHRVGRLERIERPGEQRAGLSVSTQPSMRVIESSTGEMCRCRRAKRAAAGSRPTRFSAWERQ